MISMHIEEAARTKHMNHDGLLFEKMTDIPYNGKLGLDTSRQLWYARVCALGTGQVKISLMNASSFWWTQQRHGA